MYGIVIIVIVDVITTSIIKKIVSCLFVNKVDS